jgi:hypothetical protein
VAYNDEVHLANHTILCTGAYLLSMSVIPHFTKREAKEVLKQCKALRESLDALEGKALDSLKTDNKVLRFDQTRKKTN